MVTGVDSRNPAPGSRPKPSEENVTGSPLVQHNEPFDMRFYANDPPLVDMYVHSKMKPPLMKQEGFLKHYLKAREMAITTKRSPSRRDSQWDSGPEQLAKDRDVRAWRWDSQPVYPVLLKKCLCKAYYATYNVRSRLMFSFLHRFLIRRAGRQADSECQVCRLTFPDTVEW